MTIANTPPSIEVTLEPQSPTSDDELLADVTVDEPDGDSVSYSYLWSKGGQVTSRTTDTVPSRATSKEETWTCKVTAEDGYGGSVSA